MLRVLPGPIQGFIMMVFLAVNTLFWATPLYSLVLLKLLIPIKSVRDVLSRLAADCGQTWAAINTWVSGLLQDTRWEVRIDADLDPKKQYFVCSNHQSWNDIFALMKAFGRKAPFFKFFLKQQLIWVPVLGLAWWGLDYPFMKRSTPEQIRKNPSLKGKDLEATRKACEKFRDQPVLILNFLEGTRFTKAKQANQKSPYANLLKPKAGGFAFAMQAMGDKLHALLDVTITYPEGSVGFWDFMCGRLRHGIVEIRPLNMPEDIKAGLIAGKYESSREFRTEFQAWLGQLWAEKDARIAAQLSTAKPKSDTAS